MEWHRSRWAGRTLRLAGVVSLCAMIVAAKALFGHPRHPLDSVDVLLAVITFVCGSGGSILLVFGARLFDRIAIPARWASGAGGPSPVARRPAIACSLAEIEPAIAAKDRYGL